MRIFTCHASRGWATGPIAMLLVVAVALGVLHAALPLHLHHGTTPGAYNEEHVLSALDSVTGDAPLPAGAPGVVIDLAPAAVPHPFDTPPATPVVRSTRSRAPPLA